MLQNEMKISPPVLPVKLEENSQILKMMFFICNDERISDNNTCNEEAIGRCEIDCVKECLIERSKYFESDQSSRFYEA